MLLLNRRNLIKSGAGASLAVLGGFKLNDNVEAAVQWCKTDPIFWYQDGSKAHVNVSIPKDKEHLVTGDTAFEALFPEDNHVIRLIRQPGFNGYGEHVVITILGYYSFEVYVPATESFPVRVNVRSTGSLPFENVTVEGITNEWIVVE